MNERLPKLHAPWGDTCHNVEVLHAITVQKADKLEDFCQFNYRDTNLSSNV